MSVVLVQKINSCDSRSAIITRVIVDESLNTNLGKYNVITSQYKVNNAPHDGQGLLFL